MIYSVYKKLGETPLEALESFREENNIDSNMALTYAGRLDPMAEGLLVILSGEDVYKKEEIILLDKEYELDVLWGIGTDSYDVLGVPNIKIDKINDKDIESEYKKWIKKFRQEYPPFSSKTVKGEPLWKLARKNKLDNAEIPVKEVEIKNIERLEDYNISGEELWVEVEKRISLVKGDFRQKEILDEWKKILENKNYLFKVSRFKVLCSSGTYMRVLANNMAKNLGVLGLAYRIKRDKVGDFLLYMV